MRRRARCEPEIRPAGLKTQKRGRGFGVVARLRLAGFDEALFAARKVEVRGGIGRLSRDCRAKLPTSQSEPSINRNYSETAIACCLVSVLVSVVHTQLPAPNFRRTSNSPPIKSVANLGVCTYLADIRR